MGSMDTRNIWSNFAVNKYLHTVASCWILLIQSYNARNHEYKMHLCCLTKQSGSSTKIYIGPHCYRFWSWYHASFCICNMIYRDCFLVLLTNSSPDSLTRTAETWNFPITKHCNGSSGRFCSLQGPLSAHSKIHSTPDNSVFAVFITSCARVTTRMRLLVHFTTTTYAWYECWVPQASSFVAKFNIFIYLLSTYSSFHPLSLVFVVILIASFWGFAEARVNICT